MKRLLGLALLIGLLATLTVLSPAAPMADQKKAKEKLQEIQEFIGLWNGNGGPPLPKKPAPGEIWKETISVGWKFKGDDAWLGLEFKNGKYFKTGELRYLPARDKFELTLTTAADKKLVFDGAYKNEKLAFERVDPDTKETQMLLMETLGEGVRMIYRYNTKADGSTLVKKVFEVAAGRDGESFAAAKEKKAVCVVSGGLGTMSVQYKGETFYLCCSGCAEAFKDNPEKYIAEFKARKKK
jgi:hypothetical protein